MQSLKEIIFNSTGFYGEYGGSFIPEVIRPNIEQIACVFEKLKSDKSFFEEFYNACKEISGRPTALTFLKNLSEKIGGAKLFLKNEGLNHTGAHKINHCIGQALVAKSLGKKRVIAETGAGQHGFATATVCARYGLECIVYMGKKDYDRQRPNVFWMEMLGAKVVPVNDGDQTLNDAVIAAFKDLITHPQDTYYLLGSAVGPHPYPQMNTLFQKIIGEEIKKQILEEHGKTPDYCIACVGGGSNALGMFYEFLDDKEVKLTGVEAGGKAIKLGQHASKILFGKKGIFEGYYSYFLQDSDGNIASTHSVSAGLDYCGISPILAYLNDIGRIKFEKASDENALQALKLLAEKEGIILALESAHAMAYAIKLAKKLGSDKIIVVNGSGRGEKDLFITMKHFQRNNFKYFIQSQLNEIK